MHASILFGEGEEQDTKCEANRTVVEVAQAIQGFLEKGPFTRGTRHQLYHEVIGYTRGIVS